MYNNIMEKIEDMTKIYNDKYYVVHIDGSINSTIIILYLKDILKKNSDRIVGVLTPKGYHDEYYDNLVNFLNIPKVVKVNMQNICGFTDLELSKASITTDTKDYFKELSTLMVKTVAKSINGIYINNITIDRTSEGHTDLRPLINYDINEIKDFASKASYNIPKEFIKSIDEISQY